MKRPFCALALLSMAGLAILLAVPAASWIPSFTAGSSGGPQPDHWDLSAFPVQWNLNPNTGSNISGPRSVSEVMQAAFDTWNNAPNAAVRVSRGADVGNTGAGFSASGGNTNLVCFVCQGDFSKDAETLAVTVTTLENSPGGADGHGGRTRFVGQILDADILFNPADKFATGSGGTGQDLQTVATHEIGHFLGLDHSGVVRAIMFPFAPDFEVQLGYDDVAGISTLYPGASGAQAAISGTVRFAGSGGVFGAHVFAQSVTGNLPLGGGTRKTPIGTMSLPDGSYRIAGLPPDSYIVVAEPADEPMSNENIRSFVGAFGQGSVQTNFTTRWH